MNNFKVDLEAVERVKNPLPTPTTCSVCKGPVALVNNSEIYNGRSYGKWPYAYLCRSCKSYVGVHPNTDIPLGELADRETRQARKLKTHFIALTNTHFKKDKNKAYMWLASKLGIPVEQCHWGWFTKDQCMEAYSHILELSTAGMIQTLRRLK